ncbi:MAG TPA: hypothetical protein VJ140_13970 [Actinomycetota bacterium]|nr:hypothetical protein [Actinomycetota bacterium]
MATNPTPTSWLVGKLRLLQDGKTIVRVTAVSDGRVGWLCPADGSTGTTLACIFLAVTTATRSWR